MYCRLEGCGEKVSIRNLRAHLIEHNPNATNLSSEEVLDMFQFAKPQV